MKHDPLIAKLDDPRAVIVPDTIGFGQRLADVEGRLASLERYAVSKSDVHTAVLQWLTVSIAAVVGTVVILNAIGALS